jgi:hypothetical protein
MPSAQLAGQPERMIVHFSWCLSHCDRDPTRFDEQDLLWRYCAWITAKMRMTPAVTREQIDAVFEDILRRYRRHGLNLRPVFEERAMTAAYLGDLDRAAADWDERNRLPPDRTYGDLFADRATDLLYWFFRADEARALEIGEGLLADLRRPGRSAHFIFTYVLALLARAGRLEEALRLQALQYPHLRDKVMYLAEVGHHMELLAVVGREDEAARLLERHLPWLYLTRESFDVFHFNLTADFVLRQLAATGTPEVSLRLPKECPARRLDGRYDTSLLADHFAAGAAEVARRYDARNGNDFFTRRPAEALRRLARHARSVPKANK